MSALMSMLQELQFRIPKEVLERAFQSNNLNWQRTPVSLEERIMAQVIRPRVLFAANLVGGRQVVVSLEGLTPNYIDRYNLVYVIPKERTSHCSIISALSVSHMPYQSGYSTSPYAVSGFLPNASVDSLSVGMRVASSLSKIPAVSNAHVELIAENTVLIKDQMQSVYNYFLRCIIANDADLNNINPRSWLTFYDLCELAVKAFIYNKLRIKIGEGALQGGQELGVIKEYVDECRDSESEYKTFLKEQWAPTAVANDTLTYKRMFSLMIPSGV